VVPESEHESQDDAQHQCGEGVDMVADQRFAENERHQRRDNEAVE
jgi:hypothetical protein